MQNALSHLSLSEISTQSDRIVDQLRDQVDDRDVWSVFLPLSTEPQIQIFIDYLWKLGKTVMVPQISGEDLLPVIYTSESVLAIWPFGVSVIESPQVFVWKIDVILVPWLAFTRDGKRLGRGKWYYDRFLSKYPDAKKIGLCFDCQLGYDLPVEGHDVILDEVIGGNPFWKF